MTPSERIKLISVIAKCLDQEEWPIIDLTLQQFSFPCTDQWNGSKTDYIVTMLGNANDDSGLTNLAIHIGIISQDQPDRLILSTSEIAQLIEKIEMQKALMIAVSTGGPRIQQTNEEYKSRRMVILAKLHELSVNDPNPYGDLWSWYGKWSDGSLPSYQSRRIYISNLYQPLLDELLVRQGRKLVEIVEPTGWVRVDRSVDKIVQSLATAKDEEDFQAVGLLCREVIISVAQAVYNPASHPPVENVIPSDTDAKRMLEDFIATELAGGANEELRRFVKNTYQLSVVLQHKRSATFREAALCVEATRALTNTIAIIAGQRDP